MRTSTDDPLFDPKPQGLLFSMFGAYLRPRTAPMWSGGLVALLEKFGVATATGRITLNRMVHRGLAERHRRGRAISYTLSPRALHLLEDGDNRLATLAAVDDTPKTWTVVWHNLGDSRKADRSNFVKQLRFHGFGQLQEAVWASPKDYLREVKDYAKLLGISDEVAIFRAQLDAETVPASLLSHLWRLDDLAEHYERFALRYAALAGEPETPPEEAFLACTTMLHTFRSFANLDPELPPLWTPHAGARAKALAVYREVLDALRPRAAGYFAEAVDPASATP